MTNDCCDSKTLVEQVKLPPQPSVILAINGEIHQENPCLNRIARLISQDAALAAKILVVVNSPLYRSSDRSVTSLVHALQILGLKNFYCVVISSCLKDLIGVTEETERLWKHTLVVAKTCEQIAERVDDASYESAYLTGLFHDASIPLLMKEESGFKKSMDMVVTQGGRIREFEKSNFETDHSELSYALAKSWNLPEPICDAIHFHHTDDISAFPSGDARKLGCILMLADYLSRVTARENWLGGNHDDCEWRKIESACLEELNLDLQQLDDLIQVSEDFAAVA